VIDRTGDEVKDPDVDTNEVSTAFQQSKEKKIGVVTVGDSADTAITVASETENENDDGRGNVDAGSESSSSQDTADKLESFPALASAPINEADEEHFVSRSSSESESEDDFEDSGSGEKDMEVSFVAPLQVASPRAAGSSGRTRLHVVDALGTLSRKLRKSSFSESVQLIKNA